MVQRMKRQRKISRCLAVISLIGYQKAFGGACLYRRLSPDLAVNEFAEILDGK